MTSDEQERSGRLVNDTPLNEAACINGISELLQHITVNSTNTFYRRYYGG